MSLTWYQQHLIEKHGYPRDRAVEVKEEDRRVTHAWDHANAEWNHTHPDFVEVLMQVELRKMATAETSGERA